MGHPDGMYIGLVVVAGVALLAWRWQAVRSWAERVAWRPYREAGLLVGLLALAFCVVSLLTNNSPWPASAVAARYQSWRAALLVESLVFLAVGCWLMWRARPQAPTSVRRPRWGLLLLPLTLAALVLLINQQQTGHAEATTAAAIAGAALLIAIVFPTVSADLAAVAVIALGLFSLIDVVTPPRGVAGAFTVTPGGAPQGPMYGAIDRPVVMLAAVECGAILALGAW